LEIPSEEYYSFVQDVHDVQDASKEQTRQVAMFQLTEEEGSGIYDPFS
jgi:hypothetical protein